MDTIRDTESRGDAMNSFIIVRVTHVGDVLTPAPLVIHSVCITYSIIHSVFLCSVTTFLFPGDPRLLSL